MKSIINISEKIKNTYKDIHKMTKISELIDYISMQSIEKVAAILLIIWTLSPIIIMFSYTHTQDIEEYFLLTLKHIYWYQILQTIGFLGCILNIIVFSKSILNAKKERISIKQYLKNNIFSLFLFLMLFWSILSCLISENFEIAFNGTLYRKEGLITYFTYFGILGCGYVIRNKRFIHYIFEFFTLSSTVLSVLMLINSETLNKLFGFSVRSTVFLQFNHLGYYLCMSLMGVLLLFQREKKSIPKMMFRIVIFAIITAALVENGSLGPYLAVMVGLISSVILAIWLNKKLLKRVLMLIGVFMIVTLGMSVSNHHLFMDFKTLGSDISKVVHASPDVGKAGTGRWVLWMNGLRFISEKPIFGYGPDNLGGEYAKVNISTDRPHNEIIQFAASLGIPAALFYIIAIAVHFIVFLKQRKWVSRLEIGILCIVIAYLASSMFGNTMYYTSPFFFMLLGVSAGMQNEVSRKFLTNTSEIDNKSLASS